MTHDTERQPAAWEAALERFRGGYGCDFDPADPSDLSPFMDLLQQEVEHRINRSLVTAFREATARVEAETARLFPEAKR